MQISTEGSSGLLSIDDAITTFADYLSAYRSNATARSYRTGLGSFRKLLVNISIDPGLAPVETLSEELLLQFINSLENLSPATERLYLHAVGTFYEYLDAEGLAEIRLSRVRRYLRQRTRHVRGSSPILPIENIEYLLKHVSDAMNLPALAMTSSEVIALRDPAFMITLAHTGMRVNEACRMLTTDIDWGGGQRGTLRGIGNKRAIIRFSRASIDALQDYITLRSSLLARVGAQIPAAQPLFARHDKGAGRKLKPITPTTGRNIVTARVGEILGREFVGKITPHSFRHYFVTVILRDLGDLRIAQQLARHSNVQVTQRYAQLSDEELERRHQDVFERGKSTPPPPHPHDPSVIEPDN